MENWSFQNPFNTVQLAGTTTIYSTLDTQDSKKPFRHKHKCERLPTKLVITNPWEVLCVALIGPYTIKGKDGTVMCLTMIDPASSWFEIVELQIWQ
eukprot:CCRYP_002314-RA/>CCRYP_002314-RA protein AED:0.50 eAED:0.48 QI:0/0/0/1/0/0/2/0/95